MTIRDVISRIRTITKSNNIDALITDRVIWSIVSKHTDSVLFKYRHSTNIISSPDLFTTIYGINMVEISLTDKACLGLDDCLDITIYRSEYQLPDIRVINNKLLIQSVTSVDFSYRFTQTSFGQYTHILNNRYRRFVKDKYYAIEDKYLYIFDINQEGKGIEKVNITAAFKNPANVALLQCGCDSDNTCKSVQDGDAGLPTSLLSEIEGMTLQEILGMYQINMVSDDNDNKHPLNSN